MLTGVRSIAKGFCLGMAFVLLLATSSGLLMSRAGATRVAREALRTTDGVANPTTHLGGDYYTDCSLLAMLAVRSRGALRNAIETWLPTEVIRGSAHPCDVLERHAAQGIAWDTPPAPRPYVYYWMGSRHLEAIVLRAVSYRTAESLYSFLSYASIVLLAIASWVNSRRATLLLAPIYASLLFAFGMHLQGHGLGHSPGFFIGFFLLAWLLIRRRSFDSFEKRLTFFAFLAVVTTFFELLNGPLLVLLSLSIILNYFFFTRESSPRAVAGEGVGIFACFFICFVGMNAIHLLLLSFFHDGVLHWFRAELAWRTSGSVTDARNVGMREVATNLWNSRGNIVVGGRTPSTWYLVGSVIAWVGALGALPVAARLKRDLRPVVDVAVLAAGGAGVIVWYRLFLSHSFTHSWFAVRYLALPASYGFVAAVVIVTLVRRTCKQESSELAPGDSAPVTGAGGGEQYDSARWQDSGRISAPS